MPISRHKIHEPNFLSWYNELSESEIKKQTTKDELISYIDEMIAYASELEERVEDLTIEIEELEE